MRTRVFSCQGGIQLLAALAAAKADPSPPARDYLVVHDLFSTDGRGDEFARAVQLMAEAVGNWEQICCLDPAEVTTWANVSPQAAWKTVRSALRRRVGVDSPDELYLLCFPSAGSQLLRTCYPEAKRVCFGDSMGVYFPSDYFTSLASPEWTWSGVVKRAAAAAKRIKWRTMATLGLGQPNYLPQWREDGFDGYSLLLPTLFATPPGPYRMSDTEAFKASMERLGDLLAEQTAGASLERLPESILDAPEILVLLTSNFSEAGKMRREGELQAYEEIIQGLRLGSGAVAVLKPHPRDNAAKIDGLKAVLSNYCHRVVVLNDPVTFYFPFEAIYSRYLSQVHRAGTPLNVACFSSACLSLEHLYAVRCSVGFGEDRIRRLFLPHQIPVQIRHEHDLSQAIEKIRCANSHAAGGAVYQASS